MPEELNVRKFGAVGDGKADDTRAFQAALDAAANVNGTVFVPDGVYACSIVSRGIRMAMTAITSPSPATSSTAVAGRSGHSGIRSKTATSASPSAAA